MDAVGGDRIGVAAAMLDGAVRDGEVIEVAAVRALRRLADWLLGVASGDIEAVEGREVPLRR